MRAVDLFEKNVPIGQIIREAGMSRSAVFAWKRAWLQGGRQALLTKPIPGRPPTLDDDQLAELASMIAGHAPAEYGFTALLWTRPIIADLVEQHFGVRFQPDWIGKLMRRLGFSAQRPVYQAHESDSTQVHAWRTTDYPKIRAKAAQVEATVYFADEAAVRSDHHAGTTWAPIGSTPVVARTGARHTVNMISAIEPRGSIHFTVFTGQANARFFIDFCQRLLHDDGGRVFLIVDKSPIHTARKVTDFVESTHGRLRLFFLPSYSPQLNPDELVWNNVKNGIIGRSQLPSGQGYLFELAEHALDRLAGKPDIVRGFFHTPELSYIEAV
nr:IS630 family transposase [Frankia tisae]